MLVVHPRVLLVADKATNNLRRPTKVTGEVVDVMTVAMMEAIWMMDLSLRHQAGLLQVPLSKGTIDRDQEEVVVRLIDTRMVTEIWITLDTIILHS